MSSVRAGQLNRRITVQQQNSAQDTTYAGAVAVAEAVKAALAASAITHLLLLEQDQFEPEALLHRVILDFSIWH